jgi:hypothetical protein
MKARDGTNFDLQGAAKPHPMLHDLELPVELSGDDIDIRFVASRQGMPE